MSEWEQQLQDALAGGTGRVPSQVVTRGAGNGNAAIVADLRTAATAFAKRTDSFAQGKSATCLDIAAKVERFGSFATEKQKDFALKLIVWSKPRENTPAKIELGLSVQRLFGVMQKHAHFHAGALKLSRKNQDTLCWIMWDGICVGKIENGRAVLFTKRLAFNSQQIVSDLLVEFDTNPLEAAKKYGKLSGRCCSCGRDLTDPESIEAGIGPICASRFA